MRKFILFSLITILFVGLALAQPEMRLLRFPTISGNQIVFTYEGDLWRVPADGGDARRITNDPGSETMAKFSPDRECARDATRPDPERFPRGASRRGHA